VQTKSYKHHSVALCCGSSLAEQVCFQLASEVVIAE